MLSGGTALENYATRRTSAVLAALAKRMPAIAHKLTDSQIADISLDEVSLSDRLIVFPTRFALWMVRWSKGAAPWTSPI
jgi:cation transport ATPase